MQSSKHSDKNKATSQLFGQESAMLLSEKAVIYKQPTEVPPTHCSQATALPGALVCMFFSILMSTGLV